jgi:PmbA protein
MNYTKQSEGLLATAERLIGRARAAGADQADALVVRRRSRSASIRNGEVENTESSESDDFSLRVFVGQKVATVNAGQGADEDSTDGTCSRNGAGIARRSACLSCRRRDAGQRLARP